MRGFRIFAPPACIQSLARAFCSLHLSEPEWDFIYLFIVEIPLNKHNTAGARGARPAGGSPGHSRANAPGTQRDMIGQECPAFPSLRLVRSVLLSCDCPGMSSPALIGSTFPRAGVPHPSVLRLVNQHPASRIHTRAQRVISVPTPDAEGAWPAGIRA